MPPSAHEALISRVATEIWNQGKLSVIDEVMSADAKYWGPHMPEGQGNRDHWRAAISMYRRAFPDCRVTFEELICSGDTVVGRWKASGTHSGNLPGLEPTGRKISVGGITIYRISDGKIVEAWEQLDLLGMWRQLGVVSLPGPRPE